MTSTAEQPINYRRHALICGAVSMLTAVLLAAVFGSFHGSLWALAAPGVFSALYPFSLLWLNRRSQITAASDSWQWRGIRRNLWRQILAAAPVIIALYIAQIAGAFWLKNWGWIQWSVNITTPHRNESFFLWLYTNHVLALPVLHLSANLTLVYIWDHLKSNRPGTLFSPITLLILVRMIFVGGIFPDISPMELMTGTATWPGWSIEPYSSEVLNMENFWLIIKAVWAFMLLRMNTIRESQGVSLLGLRDLLRKIVETFYQDTQAEGDGSVMRLLDLRRRTRIIFWSAAAGLPVAHVIVGNSDPAFVNLMSSVWLGLLWIAGVVMIGGRWLAFLGSPARRAVLLDICLTPTPLSTLLSDLMLAPVRQFLRLMTPVILCSVFDAMIGTAGLPARPFILIGAVVMMIILFLSLAPALMFNLLRHHSVAQAILRVVGLVLITEGIVVGGLIAFVAMAHDSDAVILCVLALHFLWIIWSLDYLLILRGDFISMAAAPPVREESLRPV